MSDFMRQRQSQFILTSDEIISRLILKATNQHIKEKQRIIEGNDSEVYDVKLNNDEHVILKVRRFGDVLYDQEAWAINECHKHAVPVPQVLFLGKELIDNEMRDVMVLEKVKGRSFRKVIEEQNISEIDVARVLEQAGSILKKIHSVKVNGYWRLNHDNQWDFDSWTDYMRSTIKDRIEDKQYLLDVGFSEEDFDFIMKCHDLYMNNYECYQPVRCHGDYTHEHWFVDESLNITGIIDFGDMQGGPVTTDFAIFQKDEPKSDLSSLIKGYNGMIDASIDENFGQQLDLHTLIISVGYLTYFIKQNNIEEMVAILTIQILSLIATSLTNLIGILTYATDYWSIIVYDIVKLRSYAKWIIIEETTNGSIHIINNTNDTRILSNVNYKLSAAVIGIDENLLLFSTHKGIFRQCNYLSANIRSQLNIPKCQAIKMVNNPYDNHTHGINNPERDSMRLHNVAAACAILIVLLLCTGTFIGITVGILNNVVLATMTVGVIYLISTMFSTFVVVIMYTILNSERKQSHCSTLETLTDELCSSQSIHLSYSFILGSLFVILSFITSVLWLFLQEKQRKFAQH
ncbi:unnamed protein product [Rotaria sp. Silwood1]|nr:unnamed protein product [Rotaria sp. Silwood1]CAF4679369.1 unnamed protein product [Rotaria sp. Silwood1]